MGFKWQKNNTQHILSLCSCARKCAENLDFFHGIFLSPSIIISEEARMDHGEEEVVHQVYVLHGEV